MTNLTNQPRDDDGSGRYAAPTQSTPEPIVTLVSPSPKPTPAMNAAFKTLATIREIAANAERDYQVTVGNGIEAFVTRTWTEAAAAVIFYRTADNEPLSLSAINDHAGDELVSFDDLDDPDFQTLEEYAREITDPRWAGGRGILAEVEADLYIFDLDTWHETSQA